MAVATTGETNEKIHDIISSFNRTHKAVYTSKVARGLPLVRLTSKEVVFLS